MDSYRCHHYVTADNPLLSLHALVLTINRRAKHDIDNPVGVSVFSIACEKGQSYIFSLKAKKKHGRNKCADHTPLN